VGIVKILGRAFRETSLKMKKTKHLTRKMLLRENTVTNVMNGSEQVGSQVNTCMENTY